VFGSGLMERILIIRGGERASLVILLGKRTTFIYIPMVSGTTGLAVIVYILLVRRQVHASCRTLGQVMLIHMMVGWIGPPVATDL